MEKLPIELLCQIFRHLPQNQLIKITTVNKLFNEIVESNNLIQGVKVDKRTDSLLPPPRRKFQKAYIRDNNATNFIKALQSTADTIKEVTFELHTTTLNSIVTVLNLLSNVKKIKFSYIALEDDDERVDAVVQPLNDIDLEFLETSPIVFKVLKQVSIKKIQVQYYGDTPYYDFTDMLPFMRVQKNLTSFSMGGIFESNLMYGHIPKGDFHLNEFKIFNSDLEDWVYLETFLVDHVGTLEKLSIKDTNGWDPSSIINQCTKLKSLELEQIEVNGITENIPSVEELSFTLPNPGINKFPNVKKLYMEQAEIETNRLLSTTMSHVNELTIRYGSVNGSHFENVTKMTLINTDDLADELFTLHTKVEELVIKNYFNLNDEQLEVIVSNLKSLRVLKIHTTCKLTARSFQIMREYCKNLKILDMKTWSQQFSANDWNCLFEINGLEIYVENFDY